ncbi:MAG: hypothetical protein GC179_03485 [Anaerolineaceae bacterium]|nr:hypothetical protein [Anaerolineaceae bacterium]
MLSTVHLSPRDSVLKIRALSFSSLHFRRFASSPPLFKCHNCHAVALRELSAAYVPIQRHQPGIPPIQNVNSAASSVLPASHFSGVIANFAVYESKAA